MKRYQAPESYLLDCFSEQIVATSSLQFREDGTGSAAIYEEEYHGEGLVKESMNEWNW